MTLIAFKFPVKRPRVLPQDSDDDAAERSNVKKGSKKTKVYRHVDPLTLLASVQNTSKKSSVALSPFKSDNRIDDEPTKLAGPSNAQSFRKPAPPSGRVTSAEDDFDNPFGAPTGSIDTKLPKTPFLLRARQFDIKSSPCGSSSKIPKTPLKSPSCINVFRRPNHISTESPAQTRHGIFSSKPTFSFEESPSARRSVFLLDHALEIDLEALADDENKALDATPEHRELVRGLVVSPEKVERSKKGKSFVR